MSSSPLLGTINLNLKQGIVASFDENFSASILNHFNAFTKNLETPETNIESAQAKAYLQLISDKICNMISDADVY